MFRMKNTEVTLASLALSSNNVPCAYFSFSIFDIFMVTSLQVLIVKTVLFYSLSALEQIHYI